MQFFHAPTSAFLRGAPSWGRDVLVGAVGGNQGSALLLLFLSSLSPRARTLQSSQSANTSILDSATSKDIELAPHPDLVYLTTTSHPFLLPPCMVVGPSAMLGDQDHPAPSRPGPLSDGNSSSLSELDDMPDDQPDFDIGSNQGSEQDDESAKDNDTEAETERIDPSPAKARQEPPAPLAEAAEKEEDDDDNEAADRGKLDQQPARESSIVAPEVEPLSPVPQAIDNVAEEDLDKPMIDIGDETAAGERAQADSPRKRKRSSSLSDIDETSDPGEQSGRRRSTSKQLSASLSPAPEDVEQEQDLAVQDEASDGSGDEQDVGPEEDIPMEPAPARKRTRRTAQEEAAQSPPDATEDVDGAEEDEDGAGQTGDQDDEGTARSEEELAKKMVAMDNFKQIESKWAIFRDKLFDEKLRELSEEQEDLEREEPTNLEYLQKRQCLDQRRDEKVRIEDRALHYKMEALERTTLAERSICHSKFAQDIREARDQRLSELNESFVKVQRERRQSRNKETQYTHTFNPKRSQQITQQRSYNREVSLLSGIAKYNGFPGAPELDGATHSDIEGDLKRMKVRTSSALPTKRTAGLIQEPQIKPRDTAYSQIANTKHSEEMAGEGQFMAKNAWARNPPLPPHVLQDRPQGTQSFSDMSTPKRNGNGNGNGTQPAGSASTIAMSDPPHREADTSAANSSPLNEMRRQSLGGGGPGRADKDNSRNPLGIFEALSERARSASGVKSAGPALTPHGSRIGFFEGERRDGDKAGEGKQAEGGEDANGGDVAFPMIRVQSRDRPQFGPIASGITAEQSGT